ADRALGEIPVSTVAAIVLVVGPEGGLSAQEVEALVGVGAVPVRLGPTILRTSTAAAVALGALGALTARWSIDTAKR
ncbi:MAG: RsmE family RNA methyltransferase, partial [Mycobacterium sp.]